MYEELFAANRRYAEDFPYGDLTSPAAKGLAVVTCIDSRIEPLQMLGLGPGDAKILRNAGGRVSQDALRSLILATNLLNVSTVAIMHHTDCAVASTADQLVEQVTAASGRSAAGWDFLPITDPEADLAGDVEAVRACPLIPDAVTVLGWRYDVSTGLVHRVLP